MRYLPIAAALFALSAGVGSTAPGATANALTPPTAAVRDVDQNVVVPSAVVLENPCNGDAVALTGSTHILIHSTESTNGGLHAYLDITSNWAGIGAPSGVTYQGTDRIFDSFSADDPYPLVETVIVETRLISSTGVDNYAVGYQIKITFNANDVPTAEVVNYTTRCTG